MKAFMTNMWRSRQEATAAPPPVAQSEDRALMLRFQSLGDNCEFGLVQRHFGAEPLGIFRFAWTPIEALISALDTRFEHFLTPKDVLVTPHDFGQPRREYMVAIREYGIAYHTEVFEGEMAIDDLRARELTKLRFLGRKILEDLQEATAIFVIKNNDLLDGASVKKVAERLTGYGPNTLLWVSPADESNPPASVHFMSPNLMRGYIDRLAAYENAHDASVEGWKAVCANALALYNGPNDSRGGIAIA